MGEDVDVGRPRPHVPAIPPDRAVVERIADGEPAVLLLGPEQRELRVAVRDLPDDAGEGTIVVVRDVCGSVTILGVDRELTSARKDALARRLARIRARRYGGRFGSDQ